MRADELATSIFDDLHPGFEEQVRAFVRGFVRGFEEDLELAPWTPAPALLGDWSGHIATTQCEVPFTLHFESDGLVWLTWDDAREGRLGDLRGGPELMSGAFTAALPFHAAHEGPVEVTLELVVEGGRLHGSAVDALRCAAGSFALPAYATMEKEW